VYSIPIKSNVPPPVDRKRKRSPSPEGSSKRPAMDTSDASGSSLRQATTLMDVENDIFAAAASASANNGARSLGADNELRRAIADNMFTLKLTTPAGGKDRAQGNDPLSNSSAPQVPHWAEHAPENAQGSFRAKHIAASREQLPKFKCDFPGRTMAYIVVGHPARGKFDPVRAKALGLEGRNRGRVANGQTVTIQVEDGNGGKIERTIRPEDVLGESFPPGVRFLFPLRCAFRVSLHVSQVTMIIDVPTLGHIDSLVSSFSEPFYAAFRSRADENIKRYNVQAVFHILGAGVLDDPRYQGFLRGFADRTHVRISLEKSILLLK
jgi:ribonuclease Z